MSWLFRFTVLLALVSALALVAVLVLYFQQISIPTFVMALGLYGLPVAFILGMVLVVYYINRRRNS